MVTPTRTGTFPVICTELCGLGHALMRSHVDILTGPKFDAWLKSGGQAAAGPPGLAVFQANGCGGCHTLKGAPGANGKVGPDLDNLKEEAAKANRGDLAAFIKESIVDPAAYLAPGFPDAMPHELRDADPRRQAEPARRSISRARLDNVTDVAATHDARRPRAPPPPTGLRRLTAPGWLRVLWVTPIFIGIGFALPLLIRWLADWDPVWKGSVLVTVQLVTAPLGFLVGLGGFDYWAYYASGRPTRPEDHSSHGAKSWRDYFRVNTDHKVIGVQYVVTTIVFFCIGGMLAMLFRAELAQPGDQFFNPQTFNVLVSTTRR